MARRSRGGASYNPWMESRYDAYAQWYAEFTRDWSPSCLPYLPSDLHGQRVLDLACGVGSLSALIADRGATVIAVDLSATMLDHAAPVAGVDYRRATPRPRTGGMASHSSGWCRTWR